LRYFFALFFIASSVTNGPQDSGKKDITSTTSISTPPYMAVRASAAFRLCYRSRFEQKLCGV